MVLGPLAEHQVLIFPQVALILGVTHDYAAKRLRRLRDAELIVYQSPYAGSPGVVAITKRGLEAIGLESKGRGVKGKQGSVQSREELDLYSNRHSIGLAWLWIAARAGAFGPLEGILAEGAMKREDMSAAASGSGGPPLGYVPHGLGVGQLNRHGNPERHYPDLLLNTSTGHRVAFELELSRKNSTKLARIMAAYASDGRIDMVIYLVPTDSLARTITDAARRAGISDLVRVQRLADKPIEGVDFVRPRARGAGPAAAEHSGHGQSPRQRAYWAARQRANAAVNGGAER